MEYQSKGLGQYAFHSYASRFPSLNIAVICGKAAPFVFWIGVILIGWIQPEYNVFADTVSKMGRIGRPLAEFANAILIFTGLLLAIFAKGLSHAIVDRKTANFLALFGILGLTGAGLLPCDELCAGDSLANVLHTLPVALGFICLQIALLQLADQGLGNNSGQGISAMSLALFQAGPFALAFFVLGRWGAVPQFEDYAGLNEKFYLAVLFGFIYILAKASSNTDSGSNW
jgi:hypothetical membrane protein